MAEMKPCPFCGGDGSLNINIHDKIVFCSCWDCGARASAVLYKGDRPTDEHIDQAQGNWDNRWRADNG